MNTTTSKNEGLERHRSANKDKILKAFQRMQRLSTIAGEIKLTEYHIEFMASLLKEFENNPSPARGTLASVMAERLLGFLINKLFRTGIPEIKLATDLGYTLEEFKGVNSRGDYYRRNFENYGDEGMDIIDYWRTLGWVDWESKL